MSPLLKLADRLSTPSLPHQKIKGGLRVLGFHASVSGLRQTLAVSSALDSHFHELENIFPSAQKILGDFRTSKPILALLNSVAEFPVGEPIRSEYIAAPFCSVIGHHEFKPVDFDQYPILAELIAFFWLVHSSIHSQPNIIVPDKLAKLLYASLDFARYISISVEDYPELVMQSQVTLSDGIENWIDFSASIFEECAPNPPSTDDIHDGFIEACELVRQLHSNQLTETQPPLDSELDEQPTKAMQRGSNLTERERLIVHHNSFQEPEIKSFAKNVRSILEQQECNHNHISIGAKPQYFFEALVVALALATGRTVRGAIEFPFYHDSPEHIKVEKFVGYNRKFNYPIWTRTISQGTALNLPLPEFLRCLAHHPIRFDDARTLEDCLPYSIAPWEDRCFEWLESLTSLSRHRLNRRIRDALARAIYKDSANSALLNWITTPIHKSNRQIESLSRYLDPLSERTVDAYSAACTNLFNKYAAPKETIKVFNKNEFGITSAEHHLISQSYLKNLQQAEIAGDYIAHHNALAIYVLMLLIISTGHRKSKTPFFFYWDILTKDNLVFISDKLSVGSEARFVPIPAWLSKLVEGYHLHLQDISVRIRSANPELANDITLVAQGDSSNISRDKPSSSSVQPSFGQFFFIDSEFKVRTITTRDLEKFYCPSSAKGIGLFRKSVANSLWAQGLSGHQIEAFLGHNSELHTFGESSSWRILKWAERVREAQGRYLTDSGWKTISIKSTARSSSTQSTSTPSFNKSTESYEGRTLSNDAALANARGIIRDLLPSEWFIAHDSKITDDDIAKLKEVARERLSADPETCEKVNQAIAREIDNIRHVIDGRVSSTIANLTRTEPGPIAVTSSRHFAIASAIRAWWINRLGSFSNDPSENFIDRLASIGFSLIIFDAVLDKSTWAHLLSAIVNHETRSVEGCLVIRSRIEKSSRIFDKSLILSPSTAAQIVGFELQHHSIEPESSAIKSATKRIEKWLKSAPHTGDSLSVDQLITAFKAWWLIRLSGTEFAIAIGNYSGPAPDIASECSLYGIHHTDSAASYLATDMQGILASPKLNRSSAISKINNLLSDAAGSFERKEQTSRRQRNQLLRLLRENDKYAELKALAIQRPIVSAMLDFLQYMLDEGGRRVDTYRFSSIRTYFSHVNSLIDVWWDADLENLETEDFDAAYSALLTTSSQSAFPIWLFHKLLRETRDVPPTMVVTSYERSLTHCRSALITTGQFEMAWKEIGLLKDDGQLVQHTRTFMGASYQYALRTREALGLDYSHVLPPMPFGILVEKNSVRDLKTKGASLRLTQPLLSNTKYQKHLGGVSALCDNSPEMNPSLFSDAEKKNSLYSRSRINQATSSILRAATGNLSVVPYSMRHSAATRLAHFAIQSPRRIPLSTFVDSALMDEIELSSFTSCFKHGFDAWPFWMDRVSMFLGHTSVDTLLNTYWHSSHIRLAEQTWYASENIKPTNQQLASMLGKERSSITTQIGRLKKANADETLPIQEVLIAHYILRSEIPELGDEFRNDQQHLTSTRSISDTNSQGECGMWIAFNRLLCRRLKDGLTIGDTIKLSEQLNLPSTNASAFLVAYEEIVRHNGFDDFEPWNSQLTIGESKRSSGVLRGAVERERGIAAAQRLFHETDEFISKLDKFTNIWVDRTDAAAPWFVARSVEEVNLIIDILTGLGVTRDQFDFISCNFGISKLSGVLTKPELSSAREQTSRVSAGPKNARVCEVGVRVKQQHGAKIGDYRDTNRLVLVLAAIVRSKRFQSSP